MTATVAICREGVRDEVADAMRCLHESLRDTVFACALVRLVSGNGQGEEADFAEPIASGAGRDDS